MLFSISGNQVKANSITDLELLAYWEKIAALNQSFYLPIMINATEALLKFRDERDWKQFHDPKNLAAALGIEAAELNEVFLWKTTQESGEVDVERVKEELADVLAYALLLANEFGLDPEQIVLDKVAANAKKYPVEKAKGVATKYTDL